MERTRVRPPRRPAPLTIVLILPLLSCNVEDLPLPALPAPTHREILSDCPVKVFLLRGVDDIYSLGLNYLADRLSTEGVETHVVNHLNWPVFANAILATHESTPFAGSIVLVGHSYGADDSIHIADYLRPHGINVELLILLDATIPPPVPSNVDRCLHLYQPTVWGTVLPFVFAGMPVFPAPGNTGTEIINRIVNVENFGPDAAEIHHFNVDTSVLIHDVIVEEILRECNPAR